MRAIILNLYWLPAIVRVAWRLTGGHMFIYRDEPAEFLRYMLWYLQDVPAAESSEHQLLGYLEDEIAMRRRRGEWP